MKVLIFHGYLLRGTGSNVYNANVAQALSRLGHDVHLFCQDLDAGSLPWVDAVGRWPDGSLAIEPAAGSAPGPGSITAYLPDIGGVLPVYVTDSYAGFDARPFADLPMTRSSPTSRRTSRLSVTSASGPAASTPRWPTIWSWAR